MTAPKTYLLALLILSAVLSVPAGAKTIALGSTHTCAITTTGKVMCWGNNNAGQLGNGNNATVTPYAYVAAKLDPNDIPIAITAGGNHTCSLLKTGLIKCWGYNDAGQLGNGKTKTVESTPVNVVTINNVKGVGAGYKHTCALLGSGKVMCWGDNTYGQLGNGTTKSSSLPVEVANISEVTDIALGANHTCALTKNSAVNCWGGNGHGQLGNKSTINALTATSTLITKQAISIVSGGYHTCAIMADKTVQCWGANKHSQQGQKKYSENNLSPLTVPWLKNIGALALGSNHTCALDYTVVSKPKLLCMGMNIHAELGLGYATSHDITLPTPISIIDPIIAVAAGSDHTCANTSIGGIPILKCWGNDSFGELGVDPKSTYLKKDLSNPGTTFGTSPIAITKVTVSFTSTPLDATPAPAVPAPVAPTPPPIACVYTYSEWSTCQSQSWGGWQTRYATSKTPETCVGEPVVSQPCTPLPPPTCASGQKWEPVTQKCVASVVPKKVCAWWDLKCVINNIKFVVPSLSGSNTGFSGTGTTTILEQSWNAPSGKSAVNSLMNDLVKATLDKAAALTALDGATMAAFEPNLKLLLDDKPAPIPTVQTVMPNQAVYAAASKNQLDTFSKLNTLLAKLLKLDPANTDIKIVDSKTLEILRQITTTYTNAFLTVIVDGPLTNIQVLNCTNDPIQNQHIYKGMDPAIFNEMIQCLDTPEVVRLGDGIGTAFYLAMKIANATHPNAAAAIQDSMLQYLFPYVISIHEVTRFLGKENLSNTFEKLYADRYTMVPDLAKKATDTNIQLEPYNFVLYNPTSKKAEVINLCSGEKIQKITDPKLNPPPPAGELTVWSDTYNCMVFKNFIKAITDPAMNKGLTCPFWDTARLWKPCLQPQPKTGWLDAHKIKTVAEALLGNILISTAYADDQVGCTNACNNQPACQELADGLMAVQMDGGCKVEWPFHIKYTKIVACAIGAPCSCVDAFEDKTKCVACLDTCKLPPKPVCGNKEVEGVEACDDGNKVNGDGCSGDCELEKGCLDTCAEETKETILKTDKFCLQESNMIQFLKKAASASNFKDKKWDEKTDWHWYAEDGDKCVVPMDVVDDNGDIKFKKGDSNKPFTCHNAYYFVWSKCDDAKKAICNKMCQEEKCGNGLLSLGEECDDGNLKDDDSCSSTCKWCSQCNPMLSPEKMPKCVAAQKNLKAAMTDTNTLGSDVPLTIAGTSKVVCKKGMPFSCVYRSFRADCENEIAVCQQQNKCGEDPRIKAQKDKICPNANSATALLKLLQNEKAGLFYNKFVVDTYFQDQNKMKMDAYKNGGVDKLQKLFPAVIQWMEYYKEYDKGVDGKTTTTKTPFTTDEKEKALAAAIATLQSHAWPANLSDAEATTECSQSSHSKTGCHMWVDRKHLFDWTETQAEVTGAHEAIHVIVNKLIGESGAFNDAWGITEDLKKSDILYSKIVGLGQDPKTAKDKTIATSVMNSLEVVDDPRWFSVMHHEKAFTEHVITEMLKQTFGPEWMGTYGGETLSDYCKGWTP